MAHIHPQKDPTATYMMPPTAGYGGYPGYYGLPSSPYMGQYGQTQAQPSTGGQPTMGQRSPRGYYEGKNQKTLLERVG